MSRGPAEPVKRAVTDGASKAGHQEAPGDSAQTTSSARVIHVWRLMGKTDGPDEHSHPSSFPTDVDECSYDELNACPGRGRCLNMEGSYQCLGHPESPNSSPQKLDGTCEGEPPGSPGGEGKP